MIQTLKQLGFSAAKGAGAFSVAARSDWRRNRLLILCYHGVAIDDEAQWDPALYVTPEKLRHRLETVRRLGGTILPLGESLERLKNGTLPRCAVAITFDDGVYDFYSQAAPVLKAHGAPATVYVTTYYSSLSRPVFPPMVSYLLWKGTGRTLDWPELLGEPVKLTPETAASTRARFHETAAQRQMSWKVKDEVLVELAARLGIDYQVILDRRMLQIMTGDEVRAVAADGFDVQLHTHRHWMPRHAQRFIKEIEDNRTALNLDKKHQENLRHFCYPSGVYFTEAGKWLKQCGVVSATTCDPGLASPASDLYYLPRVCDAMHLSDLIFEGWVTGAADLMPRRRSA